MLLIVPLFLARCASMSGTYEKEKVQQINKIAVIGFSYDAPLETSDHLLSALSGDEHSMGPGMMGGQKMEKTLPETTYSKEVYDQFVTSLKSAGWQVKSASEVRKSPSLKAFYDKAVKIGYLPLTKGDGRYEREGIPQFVHAAGLAGKQQFTQMAQELGVDAVAVVYVHAKGSQTIPMISKIHHSASVMLQIFDPTTDSQIMNFSSDGPEVEGQTKTKIGKEFTDDVQKGTLAGLDKFSQDLNKKLKQ
jgi:hypothetical protein